MFELIVVTMLMLEIGGGHVSYKDIEPIFKKRCAQCHNSTTPGMNWQDYKVAFAKRDKIRLRVTNRSMPPNVRLDKEEIELIQKWVDQGGQEK